MPGEIPSGSIHPMRKRGAQGPRQGSPLQVYSLLLLRSPTVSSAQSSRSVVSNPGTPWTAAPQASLSFTNSRSLLKLMSIKLVMPSNHLSLCRPFSSCLQSSLASGSFLMSQIFVSGSQGVGASASASILPMNFQDWFPLGLTGLISMQSKGLSGVDSHSVHQPDSSWWTCPESPHCILSLRLELSVWQNVPQEAPRTAVSCLPDWVLTMPYHLWNQCHWLVFCPLGPRSWLSHTAAPLSSMP